MKHSIKLIFLIVPFVLAFSLNAFAVPYEFRSFDAPSVGTGTITKTEAFGINNAGQIVGIRTSYDSSTMTLISRSGFLLSGGNYTILDGPAYGINNMGQIVGAFAGGDGLYTIGMGYSPLSGDPRGINDAGKVVGRGGSGTVASGEINTPLPAGATAVPPDPLGTIGTPPNQYFLRDPSAVGINNSGNIIGEFDGGNAGGRSFLLNTTTQNYTLIHVPGAGFTSARGINDSGLIVGYADRGFEINTSFLYTGGGTGGENSANYSILNFFPSGSFSQAANGINNAGQIVGSYSNSTGTHGFLATPVPEPSTWLMLTTGLVGLLGYGWRRERMGVTA